MNKDNTIEKRAGFTLGPWTSAWVGTKPHGSAVVWLGENTNNRIEVIGTGRDVANARLIASAPAMHEVLTGLLDTLEVSRGYGFDEELEKLREVLAKADGRAEA